MASVDLTKLRLIELAEAKLAAGEILLEAGSFSDTYYLAGYAAEIMLKAIIARHFRSETLPNRKLVNSLHTHKIRELSDLAGLGDNLERQATADPEFAAYWQIAVAWSEESRYGVWSKDEATQLVEALKNLDHGILPWLRQFL